MTDTERIVCSNCGRDIEPSPFCPHCGKNPTGPVEQPRRPFLRSPWIVLLGVGLLIAAVAVALTVARASKKEPAPPALEFPRKLTGVLILRGGSEGDNFLTYGTPEKCSGRGGFDDLNAGAQVTVSDEKNEIIATGNVDEGVPKQEGCGFYFEIMVPAAKIYQVEVSHRGQVRYSREQLIESDWYVQPVIG